MTGARAEETDFDSTRSTNLLKKIYEDLLLDPHMEGVSGCLGTQIPQMFERRAVWNIWL